MIAKGVIVLWAIGMRRRGVVVKTGAVYRYLRVWSDDCL